MLKKLLAVAVLSLSVVACSKAPTKEQVKVSVKRIIPMEFEVLQVSETKEIPCLYEVVLRVNNQPVVMYTDKKAQYVMSGSLMSLDKKVNLTAETLKKYLPQK